LFFYENNTQGFFDKIINPERDSKNKLNYNSYNGIMTEERETVMKDILFNMPNIFLCLYKRYKFFIYVAIQLWFSNY